MRDALGSGRGRLRVRSSAGDVASTSRSSDPLESVVEECDERLGDVALEEPAVGVAQFGRVYPLRLSGLNGTIQESSSRTQYRAPLVSKSSRMAT